MASGAGSGVFTDEQIAEMVYEFSRAYTDVIGNPWTDPPWAGIEPWYRDAFVDGVRAVRAGMDRRQLFEHWRGYYMQLGWVWGETKDPVAKTHPCLVPSYDDLPREHRRKNALFREHVLMLLHGRPDVTWPS